MAHVVVAVWWKLACQLIKAFPCNTASVQYGHRAIRPACSTASAQYGHRAMRPACDPCLTADIGATPRAITNIAHIGHNYIGHNYIGATLGRRVAIARSGIGRSRLTAPANPAARRLCIGHNYAGHNFRSRDCFGGSWLTALANRKLGVYI